MSNLKTGVALMVYAFVSVSLSSCSSSMPNGDMSRNAMSNYDSYNPSDYDSRLPQHIASTSKMIVVDPNVHAWGAYQDGQLVKAGLATAGSSWCPDIGRPCRTHSGTYHIQSLGSADCKSHIYPLPRGGAPMPYCMYFNGGQGLHGSYPGNVIEGNVSHGCVRMHVADAEWLRFNFANIGTKVVVKSY